MPNEKYVPTKILLGTHPVVLGSLFRKSGVILS